jgi:hypothetical protein
MNFLKKFPDPKTLLESYESADPGFPLKINNHVHTPYSFSAFKSIDEAVVLAEEEEVRVLGINDFNVTEGYEEFIRKCVNHSLFPLLNIELIGISNEDQQKGVRINDPGNPGRIYVSGKGLAFPSVLSEAQQRKLDRVIEESNRQVSKMVELLNRWLQFQQVEISLSVEEIMEEQARGLLRERHVAKALRLKLEGLAESDDDFYRLLQKVYGGKPTEKMREDIAGMEEELRARLLKSAAPAFVPEDDQAFLSLNEIVGIIKDAGGIPAYPMLLDGAGGKITEFEDGKEQLLESLIEWGFQSVEMIPLRNRIEVLKEYAEFFYEKGMVVSFGTEHNTTAMTPLSVSCKNEEPLDQSLMQISFNGAAYVAAHQYKVIKEGKTYPSGSRKEMEKLGQAIFHHYFQIDNL